MMMIYGMFVFALDTAAYQELQRQTRWRQEAQGRVGLLPPASSLAQGKTPSRSPAPFTPSSPVANPTSIRCAIWPARDTPGH